MIKQSAIILVLAISLGLVNNSVSPNGIPIVGKYRALWSGEGPILPPSAEAGDPSFIGLDVAEMEFSNSGALFVDARDPFEFECGTIPGSVNLAFDYLPEEDLGDYIDSVLGGVERDRLIITFCSGDECDLSLHLARILQDELGYTQVSIFFGGAREWEKFELDLQRGAECEE